MKDRPIKWFGGTKLIGVIDPALGGCSILRRGERTHCFHIETTACRCPFLDQHTSAGLWLTEEQALPLLLTGDVK